MIAAIYARKSTEQTGVADEAKSVTPQIEHAKAYAVRKGWTVDPQYIFTDDGISGTKFVARLGFVRLMNALTQIICSGVRVFFYLEDRERTLDSPTDTVMLSLTAFADELEREKARQRTYDAMRLSVTTRLHLLVLMHLPWVLRRRGVDVAIQPSRIVVAT